MLRSSLYSLNRAVRTYGKESDVECYVHACYGVSILLVTYRRSELSFGRMRCARNSHHLRRNGHG
jgi:hypothetical protein